MVKALCPVVETPCPSLGDYLVALGTIE